MAKWWCSEQQGKAMDGCPQLFGGATEVMKDLIARKLFGAAG